MIVFDNVSKTFLTGQLVLDKVSFRVKPQEMVALVGPSGSGKTTIFRLIYKDLEPDEGKIILDNQDFQSIKDNQIQTLRKKIGFAFQDFKIIPDQTVGENISLILEILNYQDKLIEERVNHLLELVGLKDKKNLFPRQLSGGELQRVAIARAIAHEPEILLADEPTGNLDPQTSRNIAEVLDQINKLGTTVIIATHDSEILKVLKCRQIDITEGKIESKEPESDKNKDKEIKKEKTDDHKSTKNKKNEKSKSND